MGGGGGGEWKLGDAGRSPFTPEIRRLALGRLNAHDHVEADFPHCRVGGSRADYRMCGSGREAGAWYRQFDGACPGRRNGCGRSSRRPCGRGRRRGPRSVVRGFNRTVARPDWSGRSGDVLSAVAEDGEWTYDAVYTPDGPLYPDYSMATYTEPFGGMRLPEAPGTPSSYHEVWPATGALDTDANVGITGGSILPPPFLPVWPILGERAVIHAFKPGANTSRRLFLFP